MDKKNKNSRSVSSFGMAKSASVALLSSAPKYAKHPKINGDVRHFLREQLDAYSKNRRAVLDKTAADYKLKSTRINDLRDANGHPPDLAKMAKKSRSFYALRAALLHDAALRGCEALRALSEADRTRDAAAKHAAWQEILTAAADFVSYPPGVKVELVKLNAANEAVKMYQMAPGIFDVPPLRYVGDWAKAKAEGRASPLNEQSNSKRKATEKLRKIAPDWRHLIFDAMPVKWKTECAILSLAGCRPEELNKGIKVEVSQDKTIIRLTIQGAMTNDGHGQPIRRLTIKDTSTAFSFLVAQGTQVYKLTTDMKDPMGSLRKALQYCGRKIFSKKSPIVSPYCFRHAMASDLKSDGASRVQIALTLGHSVTETATAYGRANGGMRGVRNIRAEGSHPVKTNHGLSVKSSSASPKAATYASPGYTPSQI